MKHFRAALYSMVLIFAGFTLGVNFLVLEAAFTEEQVRLTLAALKESRGETDRAALIAAAKSEEIKQAVAEALPEAVDKAVEEAKAEALKQTLEEAIEASDEKTVKALEQEFAGKVKILAGQFRPMIAMVTLQPVKPG